MTYRGHIENGTIVLDKAPQYPNGTEVEVVMIVSSPETQDTLPLPTLYERYKSIIGIAKGLPSDFATHDD
jgi:hypothetical protein